MLRVGVVGVNGIGQAHLLALKSVDGAVLAAVCDIDGARAAKAASDHEVASFTDAVALFGSGVVDAVVVATPPGTHAALARDALDAGLHVYCEKPVTPVSDEGYALARHAEARGRVFQVGFQFRFHHGYAALRALAAEIGPVYRANLVATNWFRAQQYFRASPWRATWRMAGGGVLMNQAIHQLDALIATVGMPSHVHARVRTVHHDAAVEDDAAAQLTWSDGATGTLVASLSEPAGREHFEIVGERGTVVLRDGYDVRVARHDPVATIVDECPDEYPELGLDWEVVAVPRARSEWFDMLVDAHREFVAAVRDNRRPEVDGVSGTRSVELANAIYLSSVRGEEVELPLPEGAYPPVFEELASGRSLSDL